VFAALRRVVAARQRPDHAQAVHPSPTRRGRVGGGATAPARRARDVHDRALMHGIAPPF
jgi:hypothetical protein